MRQKKPKVMPLIGGGYVDEYLKSFKSKRFNKNLLKHFKEVADENIIVNALKHNKDLSEKRMEDYEAIEVQMKEIFKDIIKEQKKDQDVEEFEKAKKKYKEQKDAELADETLREGSKTMKQSKPISSELDEIKNTIRTKRDFALLRKYYKKMVEEGEISNDYDIDDLEELKDTLKDNLQNASKSKKTEFNKVLTQLDDLIPRMKIEQSLEPKKTKPSDVMDITDQITSQVKKKNQSNKEKEGRQKEMKKIEQDSKSKASEIISKSLGKYSNHKKLSELLESKRTIINSNILGEIADLNINVDQTSTRVNKFSQMITEFDKNKDESLKNDLFEEFEQLNKNIGHVKTKYGALDERLKKISSQSENQLIEIINMPVFNDLSTSAQIPDEDKIIHILHNYSVAFGFKLGSGGKKRAILDAARDALHGIENLKKDFDEFKNKISNLDLTFKSRYKDLQRIVREISPEPLSEKPKPKEPDVPLPSTDVETLKKTLKKEDLINVIMRRLPEAKRSDLEAMTIDDLILASHDIGINLYDLNVLKVPKNASKEQRDLISNLEELRREREIQSEFQRLRERVTGEEAMNLAQQKENQLKGVKKTFKKQTDKTKIPKKKVPAAKKLTKAEKQYTENLKENNQTIQFNEQQVMGMGLNNKIKQNLKNILKTNEPTIQVEEHKIKGLGVNQSKLEKEKKLLKLKYPKDTEATYYDYGNVVEDRLRAQEVTKRKITEDVNLSDKQERFDYNDDGKRKLAALQRRVYGF